MEQGKGKFSSVTVAVRESVHQWLGGIGCRVSFFMMAALVLAAAVVGAYFFWENQKTLDTEIRGRALMLSRVFSSLITEDLISENKQAIYKKLKANLSQDDELSNSDLQYLMVYDRDGKMLINSSETAIFFDQKLLPGTLPANQEATIDDFSLSASARETRSPVFLRREGGYDLTVPVISGHERVGSIRVGLSGSELTRKSVNAKWKASVALIGILLVGMAFSQIIAISITKPILRISHAAEQLSQQNWETQLPEVGKDEISKLSRAFNQMAESLRHRDASLSDWNRDLFFLHTAGLDLMESLELTTLVPKILTRTEDLIRADTVALTTVDGSSGMLRYSGIAGTRSRMLKDLEMPLESGGIYNWLVSYGTPLLITDAEEDFRLNRDLMRKLGVRCIMSVPLWSANTMTGMLTALNRKGGARFDKYDLRLFTVFSSLAGAALQNASLYTDLKKSMDELKNAQEQLVHSSKMAAIGELSANIAHEINNPLTSVLGYTSHLIKTLDLAEEPKRILGMMEQETLRVRKIIRNLLDFSRLRPSWMQQIDLHIPIKESLALVQGMADASSVRVYEDYPASPITVTVDHNEMKQVFINLIYNALQAMPHGGALRIRLGDTGGNETVVEIQDTGIGIPQENLDKIFEPFFSTKENGGGTGLGLAISYRIVQNHGGRITVESAVGKGTTFRVYLPLSQEAAPMHSVG